VFVTVQEQLEKVEDIAANGAMGIMAAIDYYFLYLFLTGKLSGHILLVVILTMAVLGIMIQIIHAQSILRDRAKRQGRGD
jgi:Flp pilus assembly protein TadB